MRLLSMLYLLLSGMPCLAAEPLRTLAAVHALSNEDARANPLFPASGLATGSLNGINPKSKFLAFDDVLLLLKFDSKSGVVSKQLVVLLDELGDLLFGHCY